MEARKGWIGEGGGGGGLGRGAGRGGVGGGRGGGGEVCGKFETFFLVEQANSHAKGALKQCPAVPEWSECWILFLKLLNKDLIFIKQCL